MMARNNDSLVFNYVCATWFVVGMVYGFSLAELVKILKQNNELLSEKQKKQKEMEMESNKEKIVMELMNHVINGKDSKTTFVDFPNYLSEGNRILLTRAGYAHLGQKDLSKHMKALTLTPVSRAILLSGPGEFDHQELVKALAHNFESKLLLLDITDISFKMHQHIECQCGRKEAPSKCTNYFYFGEGPFMDSLYEALVFLSKIGSVILYIKNVEKLFLQSPRIYDLFQNLVNNISGSVLIVGSRINDSKDNSPELDKQLTMLFPYNIEIKPPQDETQLKNYNDVQLRRHRNYIAKVLAENDIYCDDLNSDVCHTEIMLLGKYIEEILANTICYNLMNTNESKYRDGKLIVPAKSLYHVLSIFKEEMKTKELNKITAAK